MEYIEVTINVDKYLLNFLQKLADLSGTTPSQVATILLASIQDKQPKYTQLELPLDY